jgi:hypothetical protein
MKKLLFIVAVVIAVAWYQSSHHQASQHAPSGSISERHASGGDAIVAEAYANHLSNLQVSGEGIVVKLLADDNEGSRHQRFILELSSGHTLLIAHNIDIAPKIGGLRPGDSVQFCGEYEWNPKGGVIHWTHRDPNGAHPAGWLICHGQTYW